MSLILASASKSRRDLLKGAGLDVQAIASSVDEDIIKQQGLEVIETALELSKAKALDVAKSYPDHLIIGADQMMECEGLRFDKPNSLSQAKEQLKFLRGKTHHLISAVAIVDKGAVIWSSHQVARLKMRAFSDDFLEDYLSKVGEDVLTTVGGYRLESLGVQLFEQIEGDYFTILGLPLLSVLAYLRAQDMIKT